METKTVLIELLTLGVLLPGQWFGLAPVGVDEPPSAQESPVPPLPKALLERLRGGPVSADEAERLVRRMAGLPAAAGSVASSDTQQGVSPELQRWLQLRMSAISSERELDTRSIQAAWRLLDQNRDRRLSFLELRNAAGSLPNYRELDADRDGQIRRIEFAQAAVLGLDPAGWLVHPELRLTISPETVEQRLTELGSTEADARNQVILNRVSAQLGRTMSPDASRANSFAGLSPVEVANRVAAEVYPLPRVRQASGGGWKQSKRVELPADPVTQPSSEDLPPESSGTSR